MEIITHKVRTLGHIVFPLERRKLKKMQKSASEEVIPFDFDQKFLVVKTLGKYGSHRHDRPKPAHAFHRFQ